MTGGNFLRRKMTPIISLRKMGCFCRKNTKMSVFVMLCLKNTDSRKKGGVAKSRTITERKAEWNGKRKISCNVISMFNTIRHALNDVQCVLLIYSERIWVHLFKKCMVSSKFLVHVHALILFYLSSDYTI